jgi:hypothetical protein
MQDDRAVAIIAFAIVIAAVILAAGSSQYCDYRISQVVEKCNSLLLACKYNSEVGEVDGNIFNDTTRAR